MFNSPLKRFDHYFLIKHSRQQGRQQSEPAQTSAQPAQPNFIIISWRIEATYMIIIIFSSIFNFFL